MGLVIVGLHHMEEVWVYNAIKIQLNSSKLSMITHYGCISNFALTWIKDNVQVSKSFQVSHGHTCDSKLVFHAI